MITSKSFENRLLALAELDVAERDIIPGREPSFNVYLNTRKIEVPSSFKQLAIQGERNAETIWFALDRYFDGEDLKDKAWGIQFINAIKEEMLVSVDYKQLDKDDDKTLLLGWDIPWDITKEAGTVLLALRCWTVDEGKITYDLRTEDISLTIGKGIDITVESDKVNPPADALTKLVARIEDLYMDKQLTDLKYEEIESKPTINSVELSAGENDASKFNIRYSQLDQNTLPTITVDGQSYTVGIDDINVSKITVDENLDATSENPVQNKVVNNQFITTETTFTNAIGAVKTELDGKISTTNSNLEKTNEEIEKIKAELGNMTYIPLSIKSFESDTTFLKKNEVFNGIVNFDWTVDGNVKSQKIEIKQNNEIIDTIDLSIDARNHEYQTTNWSDDIECILTVTDAQGKTATAIVNIVFTYEIFYGISTVETFTDNSFTELEEKVLSTSKSIGSFTVNASGDNYIYYCSPAEYGVPTFRYGVLYGGFFLVNENIEYNNINYNIYRSEHKGLGETTIIVG